MTYEEIKELILKIAEIQKHRPPFRTVRMVPHSANAERSVWLIRAIAKHGTFKVEPEEGDTPEELALLINNFASDLSVANEYEKNDGDRIRELERQVETLNRRAGIDK